MATTGEKSSESKIPVLFIGTDESLLDESSAAAQRVFSYARGFEWMHVIVLCSKSGQSQLESGENITVYRASSRLRIMRAMKALVIARHLRRVRVVSAQDPFENGLLALIVSHWYRAALHVQVHTDFTTPAYRRLSLRNFFRYLLAPYVLKHAVRIRVVSDRIRTEILRKMPTLKAPIIVLPIFVDVDRFSRPTADVRAAQRTAEFAPRILIVSRLEKEKNVALAIESFAKVAPKSACLIILGSGREKKRLIYLAARLGVTFRVFFEGEQDAGGYYPFVDLVLLTSHYEGYGRVVIEALAAGKPVLATDVGIAREAGAIVTSEARFEDALREWFTKGPRNGKLHGYPYTNFAQYVESYVEDIIACIRTDDST